jgi:hypothetical protein
MATVLTLIGVVLLTIGIYSFIWGKQSGENKIELLGLKINVSSPSLLLIVIGLILVLPIIHGSINSPPPQPSPYPNPIPPVSDISPQRQDPIKPPVIRPNPHDPSYLPTIDWGVAEEYFTIENIKLGKQKTKNSLGAIQLIDAIMFTVTSKINGHVMQLLTAVCYDARGQRIDDLAINFESKYRNANAIVDITSWHEGDAGIGYILLFDPKTLDNVKTIKIQPAF